MDLALLLAAVIHHDDAVAVRPGVADVVHGVKGIERVRAEAIRQRVAVFVLAHGHDGDRQAVLREIQRAAGILIVFAIAEGRDPASTSAETVSRKPGMP